MNKNFVDIFKFLTLSLPLDSPILYDVSFAVLQRMLL